MVKAHARQRHIPFKIEIKETWDLFIEQGGRCTLTGVPLTLHPSHLNKGANTASLDRIDSTKGYVKGNIQWVHKVINFMKSSLSDAEFIRWCELVAHHRSAVVYGAEFGKGKPGEY